MAAILNLPTCRIRPTNWRAASRPSIRATSAMRWEPMRPALPSSRLSTAPENPCGLTCNSFASVSLNPPLVLWSSVDLFPEHERIPERQSLCGQRLGISQQALAAKFAMPSSRKFEGVDWTPGLGGVPLLAEALQIFNAAPPIAIMAETMSSSSVPWRPTATTETKRCCFLAVAMAASSASDA